MEAKNKTEKNSLVKNINKKKAAGTSKSKKKSTVSPEAYEEMKDHWSKKKK